MKRYEQVALNIETKIKKGIYKPGDKLPSVRHLHQQLEFSITTILEAYRLLEDHGIIYAAPKSGYFVKQYLPKTIESPALLKTTATPKLTSISELVMQVTHAINQPEMIQLGAAMPSTDFPAVKQFHRILSRIAKQSANSNTNYYAPPGYFVLRQQLAKRATESGCSIHPDELIITSGCQEAIYIALKALTKPGDIVAIENPTFYGVIQAVESLRLKSIEIPTDPNTGIDLNAFETILKKWPVKACLLTPNFSNPTGYLMPDEDKKHCAALINQYQVPLIEDDIYGELNHHGIRPKTIQSYDYEGNVLLCSSVSKSLEPGIRMGWIAPGKYYHQVELAKYVTNLAAPTLPQIALAEFLANGGYDRHLRLIRQTYRQRQARLLQLICQYFPDGIKATQPTGGFLSWLELPKNIDIMALYQTALVHNISFAPGKIFSTNSKYHQYIRLNYAHLKDEQAENAVKQLGGWMK